MHSYSAETEGDTVEPVAGHKPQASWWRNIYNRISQSGAGQVDPNMIATSPELHSPKHSDRNSLLSRYEYDEPPPPSAIRTYRNERRKELDTGIQTQLPEPPQILREDPWADRNDAHSLPVSMVHSAVRYDETAGPFTTASAQRPLSPLCSYLGDAFARSVTDHETVGESEPRSPGCVSTSLDGFIISQPLTATRPAIVTQTRGHESEVGDLHTELYNTNPRTEVPVVSNQGLDATQDAPPPVPPKPINQDRISEELPPRRPSHRRESAQHRDLTSLPSPPSHLKPSQSSRLRSSVIDTFPTSIHDPTPSSRASGTVPLPRLGAEPRSPDQRSDGDPPASAKSARIHRGAARTPDIPQSRPRQYSLPVPVPYAVPAAPGHTHPRQPASRTHRRMSAPLDSIPQHSVSPNLNSQNRPTYRPSYPSGRLHHNYSSTPRTPLPQTGSSRSPETLDSNSWLSRRMPRVPIMPEPLAPASERIPHAKPRTLEGRLLGLSDSQRA